MTAIRSATLVAATCAAALAASARAGDDAPTKSAPPDVRLVHLLDGLRPMAPNDDPARVAETETAKNAAKFGLDLAKPEHPLLSHASKNGRVWYVFYKVVENAFGDRPYMIQRIKKIERTWLESYGAPEVKTTYQVEVFKTWLGTLKQPDQHFGDFGIRDAHRREIIKEYEIGFGEAPGVCEGATWPFDAGTLYKLLQPYAPEPGVFDKVAFTSARRWTLEVKLAADGKYSIRSPELGIDAPSAMPDPKKCAPKSDASSKDVVLLPGVGLESAKLGAPQADVVRALGEPFETTQAGKNVNLSFRRAITCNFDATGVLNTIITRADFAGRTSHDVAHGMSRADVMKKLGVPKDQRADAVTWRYDGALYSFDGFDRVTRIVIYRKREAK
jgi:hypothetical protein